MSSSSSSARKCPLCFKSILVKNFKRHCNNTHNTIDNEEKYKKLFFKFKGDISKQVRQSPTSETRTSNEPLTSPTTSNEPFTSPTTSNEPFRSPTTSNEPFTSPTTSNEPFTSPTTSNEPFTSPTTSNEPLTSTPSSESITDRMEVPNESITDTSEVPNESSLVPPIVVLKEHETSYYRRSDVEIKNRICGEIQYAAKQAQLAFKIADMAFDETISTRNFLIEATSSIGKLNESLTDLLISCNEELERIPLTSITIEELKSTETFVSRDPSLTKVYNDQELRYLVSQGPYQPILLQYPINQAFRLIHDTCHFNPIWYKEFPLIEYSIITDSIYCFCCRLFGSGPGTERLKNGWTSSGMKTWNKMKASQGAGKRGKIYVHIESEVHKSSLQRYLIFKERKNNVDYMLNKNLQQQEQQQIEQQKSNQQIIEMLIDCVRYLARQGLACRGQEDQDGNFYQLVHLLSRHNSVLEDWIKNINNRPYKITYMSKDSQNEFIQLLGDCVQHKNLCEIKEASYYSIMADSSIDSNRQDMLSIFIRFVNKNGEPEERFVSIKPLHLKTGDGIANHILEVLNELDLDLDKLIAQSYDCANNMSGEFNGVRAKINEKLRRDTKYIPCSSHRSNTVVKHASEASLDIFSFFGVLQSIYVFFTSSTKRLAVLDEKISSNLFALTPKPISIIRWNAKYQSIRAVYESYDELIKSFGTIVDDRIHFDKESRQGAHSINTNLTTFNFITYLVFMKNLMAMTNSITTQFQAEQLDLIAAREILIETVRLLETERSNEFNLNNLLIIGEKISTKYDIDPDVEFNRKHRVKRPPKRFDDNPQTTHILSRTEYYRKTFRQVIDQLITEYKQLLMSMDKNIESLAALSPKYILNFTATDADNISKMVQINDSDLLYSEIQLFKEKIYQCETILNASKFIHERKASIPLIAQAYQYLLTLPVTTASVERSFSKMKIVKNRLRTKMGDERLDSLLTCTLETFILDQLKSNELVEKWSNNKTGRRMQFV
ncbi:unnamed protein product [Rotaria socialis]